MHPILLAAALLAEAAMRPDTTGLYPIWESTGHVERAGDLRLGTTGALVGIGNVVQVGVQPIPFIYRSPNAFAKVEIFQSERWKVAVQAGGYRLLAGASRAFFSPMYSTRLDNPDFGVTLVPVSISASAMVAPWLEVHQTLTGLGRIGEGPLRSTVTPGYAACAELNPLGRHALSLHAAETGFWAHDLAIAGADYRYRNQWLELRLGYFYRFSRAGTQSGALFAFGVLL